MSLKYMAMIAIGSSLLLAGCGSDETTTDTGTSGGSNPSVTGVISSQDLANETLTVNNTVYDASGAAYTDEGMASDPGMVDTGMVVTIEGPHADGQGVAHKIKYDSEVEGVVITSDIVLVADSDPMTYEGSMNVMGQTVIINSMTMFKDMADPTMIVAGNVVEISGMFQDDGSILAKRVEYKADALTPDEEVEIKGYVTDYDAVGGDLGLGTFMLGMCKIIITADTELDDIDVLEEGMKVEVESIGELVTTDPSCMVNALEIENEDHDGYHDMAKAEGMVVGDLLDGMFMLQYEDQEPVKVMVDENTHYINGTEEDIVEGAKLKAAGMVNDNDELMAKVIKFEDDEMDMEYDKVEGQVTSELMDGMFDLEDKDGNTTTVAVTADTHFLPVGATAADIKMDSMLKAVGMYDDSVPPKLVAKLIKLEGMDINHEKVKGTVVGELLDNMFTLEDKDGTMVTVVITADTQYLPMDATAADIKDGAMLMAVGMLDGDKLVAALITFKDMGGVKPPMPGVPPMVKYHGSVEAVELTDVNDPTLGGTLTVLGQVITVTADTKIYKEMMTDPIPMPATGADGTATMSVADIMLTLADINVDDYVMVMPYVDDMGVLTARIIELKPAPEMSKSMVFGPITAADVDMSTLTVGGVMVTVDDAMTNITPMGTDIASIAAAIDAGMELTGKAEGSYATETGITASHVAVHEPVVIM